MREQALCTANIFEVMQETAYQELRGREPSVTAKTFHNPALLRKDQKVGRPVCMHGHMLWGCLEEAFSRR